MTLNVNDVRDEYTATSSQTIFNYTFKIYASTDLDVYVTPTGQDCADGDLTTAYTVAGVGAEAGGSITLTSGATVGDLVTIVSSIPSSRTTDYQNNGDFRPDTVNDDFDRTVSLVKQAIDKSSRGLSFLDCEQGVASLTLPPPSANNFLRWKTDLSGMENFTFSSTGIVAEVSVDDYPALRSLSSSTYVDGQVIFVTDDDVGGEFIVKTGTVTDNKITLFPFTDDSNRYAERLDQTDLTLEMYEDVVGNGTSDDTVAINAALALGPTLFSQITATSAEYRCTNTITVPGSVALNTSKGGRSKFKFYADVIGFIMAGPVAHLRNRVTIELDTSVTGTKNCIEVGTAVVKSNACEISVNILAYGTISSTAASVGDGIYIKNGNFVKIHDSNLEFIGRDGLHVSDDTGDTNAGYITNTYVNVSGRDAYYFGPDVSDWRGFPNCLTFQRYGIMFDQARFNRLVGDIESVGNKGSAWTFGPDIFQGYEAGVRYEAGSYGNEVQVFPVADHEFETITEEQRNICKRRAGANEWEAIYGLTQFSDGFWINDETIAGELQFSQSGTGEYTINAGGTGGASILKFTKSGTTLATSIQGSLELIPNGRLINPSVNADDLHIHAVTGNNVGISLLCANTQQASIRAADPQNDSAGTIIYDHATNAWTINSDDANSIRFDKSVTGGQTRFLIYDVDNATLERVTVGAADSGGVGFKVLRIPN